MRSQRWGSTHRVAPTGELDIATGPALERELRRVEETDVHGIELDLSGVTFIDSAGVRVLTDADARARIDGSRLRIMPGPRAVQRVLDLVGADQTLPLTATAPGHTPRVAPSESRCLPD